MVNRADQYLRLTAKEEHLLEQMDEYEEKIAKINAEEREDKKIVDIGFVLFIIFAVSLAIAVTLKPTGVIGILLGLAIIIPAPISFIIFAADYAYSEEKTQLLREREALLKQLNSYGINYVPKEERYRLIHEGKIEELHRRLFSKPADQENSKQSFNKKTSLDLTAFIDNSA